MEYLLSRMCLHQLSFSEQKCYKNDGRQNFERGVLVDSPHVSLRARETIVYHTKEHWTVFIGPILIVLMGMLSVVSQGRAAAVLIILGTLLIITGILKFRKSSFLITNQRVLIESWFLRTDRTISPSPT